MPRFVLLEHTGHPDDPAGRHYDLLLEDGESCHAWRLAGIPVAGEPVAAEPLPPHRLAWLEIDAAEVSGGRGFVRRFDAGLYDRPDDPVTMAAADSVRVRLHGTLLRGGLRISGGDRGTAILD